MIRWVTWYLLITAGNRERLIESCSTSQFVLEKQLDAGHHRGDKSLGASAAMHRFSVPDGAHVARVQASVVSPEAIKPVSPVAMMLPNHAW